MDEKKQRLKEQKAAWDKANTKMIPVKLQHRTDADILAYLEGESRQTIIKAALREYMANHPKD